MWLKCDDFGNTVLINLDHAKCIYSEMTDDDEYNVVVEFCKQEKNDFFTKKYILAVFDENKYVEAYIENLFLQLRSVNKSISDF